ncbi:phospholipase D family protein [Halobacillus sp. A5]|uniref:phospholipase D family protein n=1 Tax=Halobacillus sp. A5 TaxID=2880263 RepID=UPI0020A63771|nr:phospholipase D family protein [Halobacillus sp. A5]MCP3026342.1 phospholipase D family protein [Halobacillus sp. A5]
MKKLKKIHKKKWFWIFIAIIILLSIVIAYHTSWKIPPEGVAYEGEFRNVEDIEFYNDLTYENDDNEVIHELEIFEEMYETISEAEDFIVIDMFLFNGYSDEEEDFPNIAEELTDRLIEQKEKHEDLKVVFITDEINTVYGSYESEEIDRLRDHEIDVVLTDLNRLRDSNPVYSSIWRVMFSWMGTGGTGWIDNPFAKEAPDVTLRSYLKLLNVKANHRKVLITEDAAMVSTANPHDESGFHENVAFKMTGPIIKDLLEAEEAVVNFSGEADYPDYEDRDFGEESGNLEVQYITEQKIKNAVVEELKKAEEGDQVWLGMYYLADRHIIDQLDKAADRGAVVNIIMDPNKQSFGHEKSGLPNLPVAAEMNQMGNENLNLRWYEVNMEQFHPKLLYIDRKEENVIVGGSGNYTRRNLANLNLEADVRIKGDPDEEIFTEVDDFFTRIWENEDGNYTVEYEEYQDELTTFRYITYHLQKWSWFTSY